MGHSPYQQSYQSAPAFRCKIINCVFQPQLLMISCLDQKRRDLPAAFLFSAASVELCENVHWVCGEVKVHFRQVEDLTHAGSHSILRTPLSSSSVFLKRWEGSRAVKAQQGSWQEFYLELKCYLVFTLQVLYKLLSLTGFILKQHERTKRKKKKLFNLQWFNNTVHRAGWKYSNIWTFRFIKAQNGILESPNYYTYFYLSFRIYTSKGHLVALPIN